jgi:hypothetical protein
VNVAVKCIGKPCAGKSHARFDEGTQETWTMVMSALQRASVLLNPFGKAPFGLGAPAKQRVLAKNPMMVYKWCIQGDRLCPNRRF